MRCSTSSPSSGRGISATSISSACVCSRRRSANSSSSISRGTSTYTRSDTQSAAASKKTGAAVAGRTDVSSGRELGPALAGGMSLEATPLARATGEGSGTARNARNAGSVKHSCVWTAAVYGTGTQARTPLHVSCGTGAGRAVARTRQPSLQLLSALLNDLGRVATEPFLLRERG